MIGGLNKLHIKHENSGLGAPWYLDKVEAVNMNTNEKYLFPCNRWLSTKHNDCQLQRDLLPIKIS